ncbi:MAG: peptide deformylase [bacterium]
MPLKISKFPAPVLRKTAKPVKKVTPEIIELIDKMIATMKAAPGIGLAAPQVGRSLRVIVLDIGEGEYALINPEVIDKSGGQTILEGCLSLPGVEAPVERASWVKVKGIDRDGEEVVVVAEGLLATVFQHEIDHLEGHVFIDRVKDPSLIKHVPRSKEKKEELI